MQNKVYLDLFLKCHERCHTFQARLLLQCEPCAAASVFSTSSWSCANPTNQIISFSPEWNAAHKNLRSTLSSLSVFHSNQMILVVYMSASVGWFSPLVLLHVHFICEFVLFFVQDIVLSYKSDWCDAVIVLLWQFKCFFHKQADWSLTVDCKEIKYGRFLWILMFCAIFKNTQQTNTCILWTILKQILRGTNDVPLSPCIPSC